MKRKDVINKYGESVFDGKVKGYIGNCILQVLAILFFTAIGGAAFYFLGGSAIQVEEETISLAQDQILFLVLGVAALLFFVYLGVTWSFCISLRWTLKHTTISGFRLYFDGKTIQLFGNFLKWFFLTIITLGIYSFFIPVRYKQWEVKHTKIDNSVENANLGNNNSDFVCPPVYVQPMMPQYPSYPSYPSYPPYRCNCPYENKKK